VRGGCYPFHPLPEMTATLSPAGHALWVCGAPCGLRREIVDCFCLPVQRYATTESWVPETVGEKEGKERENMTRVGRIEVGEDKLLWLLNVPGGRILNIRYGDKVGIYEFVVEHPTMPEVSHGDTLTNVGYGMRMT
jgi:hypothetical protein